MLKRFVCALLACALLLRCAAAETMLGVQVKDTAAPTQAPAPQATAAQEETPEPITDQALEAAKLGERILLRGMEGEDVALVQQRLHELGYYLGRIDGVFGLGTRSAVYAFQRAHKLEKIDGKVGPATIERLFADDAIVKPTPTPTPTPTPRPTPTPTPTPLPTPEPTPTPDIASAPFAMEAMDVYVDEIKVRLFVGRDERGELLYPLGGVMGHMGYEVTHALGSWVLDSMADGPEVALMTDGQDGACVEAMGAVDGVIFLMDEDVRVYVYGEEAYVTDALLMRLGASVLLVGGVPVIHH